MAICETANCLPPFRGDDTILEKRLRVFPERHLNLTKPVRPARLIRNGEFSTPADATLCWRRGHLFDASFEPVSLQAIAEHHR